MTVLVNYLGFTFVSQLTLLLVFWLGRPYVEAANELYQFSPKLFYFYTLGSLTTAWFLMSVFRAYVLKAGLGERARRHSRTRRPQ